MKSFSINAFIILIKILFIDIFPLVIFFSFQRILCLPIQIKAKLYPFVLIILFSVLVGPRFDLLISVLFGFLDYKLLQNKISIKKNYIIAIEASDYMTFVRNIPCIKTNFFFAYKWIKLAYVSILKIPTDVENPQNKKEFNGVGQELGKIKDRNKIIFCFFVKKFVKLKFLSYIIIFLWWFFFFNLFLLGASSKNQYQGSVENLNELSLPKETKLNVSQDKFVELNEE